MKISQIFFLFCITITVAGLVLISQTAHTAGGGGGGSVPICTADTWNCSVWNTCSEDHSQTRTCEKTFDCAFADTPRPAEKQGCTPLCTEDFWQCGDWSECDSNATQTRNCLLLSDCASVDTAKPSETKNCIPPVAEQKKVEETPSAIETTLAPTPPKQQTQVVEAVPVVTQEAPSCTEDTWDCVPWSDCDKNGDQRRTCAISLDCSAVETKEPALLQKCQKLQCGELSSIRERVLCRLNLSPAGITREYEIEYLPEECRTFSDSNERIDCIECYKSFKPCWVMPIGDERFSCAKEALELSVNIPDDLVACNEQPEQTKQTCLKELQIKVYHMIKFRMYDLEERAEDLLERGVDTGVVADFVTFIQKSKVSFNNASTKVERRQVILDVRDGWQKFVSVAKDQIN